MLSIKIISTRYFPNDHEVKVAHKRRNTNTNVQRLKNTNVKRSRLFYETNILHDQFSKICKFLIVTPPWNKQQGESKISEIPFS